MARPVSHDFVSLGGAKATEAGSRSSTSVPDAARLDNVSWPPMRRARSRMPGGGEGERAGGGRRGDAAGG